MRIWRVLLTCTALLFASTASSQVIHANNDRLAQLIADGAPVIDIRTAAEWKQTGVIENSHLLTFFDDKGGYDVNQWMRELSRIAKPDEPVVILCLSGSRSMVLSQFLTAQTQYRNVINVTQGIDAWLRAGHPVVAHP